MACVKKGLGKKRRTWFQKGRKAWNKDQKQVLHDESVVSAFAPPPSAATIYPKIERMDTDTYNDIVKNTTKGTLEVWDEYERDTGARILRPKPSKPTFLEKYNEETDIKEATANTNIVVHRRKTAELWNNAFKDHLQYSINCQGTLDWNDRTAEKRGLCWNIGLRCTLCAFETNKYKLYDEVESDTTGRKSAAPNVGLVLGMMRHGIGPEGITDIIASLNIDPPSIRGIHKTAEKVAEQVVKTNDNDISEIIESLQTHNTLKGLPEDNAINAEADGTYMTRTGTAVGHKPGQGSSQSVYLISEQSTRNGKIIYVGTYSKLCNCPGNQHKETCEANLSETATIGNEGKYLTEGIEKLNKQGITIKHITLDGDSNANAAAASIQQGDSKVEVETQRCTHHLTKGTKRKIKNTTFSNDMFPGTTKADRTTAQALFCLDIGNRCQAECTRAYDMFGTDVEQKRNKLSYVPEAIMACYSGDCSLCNKYSLVCQPTNRWKRPYLNSSPKYKGMDKFINMTENDRQLLRVGIDMRMDMATISKTNLNSSQNKTEAANRGLAKTIPKHLTFTKTFKARVNISVHSQNNAPGESLVKMCQACGASISPGSKVVVSLIKKDKIHLKHKIRKRSRKYKIARAAIRNRKYRNYNEQKEAACYRKGMADEGHAKNPTPTNKVDHLYMKRKQ